MGQTDATGASVGRQYADEYPCDITPQTRGCPERVKELPFDAFFHHASMPKSTTMNLKPLHQLLRVSSHLLDQAASDVRDTDLAPVSELIEKIGRALFEIIEVQLQIYEVQPELRPKSLKASSAECDACQVLTQFMIEALELEDAGKTAAAVAVYEEFIGISLSFAHREFARAQVRRLAPPEVSAR